MDGELVFTVTHPFHPLTGQQFPLLAQRFAWGEVRVFFLDPLTDRVRSLPATWTDRAPADPFVALAAGRTMLRLTDLQQLVRVLREPRSRLPNAGSGGIMDADPPPGRGGRCAT